MITNYLSLLDTLPADRRACVLGYRDDEIKKIESLYGIVIDGEFREFMQIAGRCDGGLVGDDPLIVYRNQWNARTHILFQMTFFNDLQDLGAWGYLNKPFVFSLESETQYYYLRTGVGDGLVYHYDENQEIVKCTDKTFSEYMLDVVCKYKSIDQSTKNIVCCGDLLNI